MSIQDTQESTRNFKNRNCKESLMRCSYYIGMNKSSSLAASTVNFRLSKWSSNKGMEPNI